MADNRRLHTYNYVLVSCHRPIQIANLFGREANAIYVKGCNYGQVDFGSSWKGRTDLILTSSFLGEEAVKKATCANCAVI